MLIAPGINHTASALALGAAICSCGGCGETPAKAGESAAAPAAQESPAAASDENQDVRDFGRGLQPQRGPVQVLPPGSVPVEFEPAQMDFGVLPPGAAVRGTTRIWNTGDEPLTILESITSCGCTAAEDLAGRVIEPGGSTEFSTTMNMKAGLGEKKEKITVYFGPDKKRIAIQYYTAEVALPIRIVPPHLTASSRHPQTNQWSHTLTGQVRVESLQGEPFRILRAHGAPPDFVGFDPATDAPRDAYTLRWDLTRFGGDIPWFWVLETDRPDCPVVDARIRHASTLPPRPPGRPWVPKDQRVLAGAVRPGEPFEVITKVEYHPDYPPAPATAAVQAVSPFLAAGLLEAQRDGQFIQYRIRVTATDAAEAGMLYGELKVFASGFEAPLLVIGTLEEP